MKMDAEELDRWARDGFLLRRGAYAPAELAGLRDAVEALIARVVEQARRPGAGPQFRLAGGHRFQLSSQTLIQWEWREGSPEVRLIEPFTHLDPRFGRFWEDPRLVLTARDALGADEVCPFTCKLNLKRPREGSEFPWHQDYPYWYVRTPGHAHEIVTAMLFLDDADRTNGALRVLPGSHLDGPAPRDRGEASGFLADSARIDASREVLVEAEAGSVLFFPALLLHRSTPNASERQRRAILLSFQPAGRPRQEKLDWRPQLVNELP
jgi:ectoine hydroxylase